MILGRVLGQVVSTIKVETLKGIKLMVVQIEGERGEKRGRPVVAADAIGDAGPGDHVFLALKKEAAMPFEGLVPVDLSIVGFVDEVYSE
jgi:ethanolamine utilization protein EutN